MPSLMFARSVVSEELTQTKTQTQRNTDTRTQNCVLYVRLNSGPQVILRLLFVCAIMIFLFLQLLLQFPIFKELIELMIS